MTTQQNAASVYTLPSEYSLVFDAAGGPRIVFVDEDLAAETAACDAEADGLSDGALSHLDELLVRDAARTAALDQLDRIREQARHAVEQAAAAAVAAALLDDPLVDVDVLTHRAVLLQALTYRTTRRHRTAAAPTTQPRRAARSVAQRSRRSA